MRRLTESKDSSDVVTLRVPRGIGVLALMRVIVGGVAARHALSVEGLDDVQLAVETLVGEEPGEGEALTLSLSVVGEVLRVTLAGLSNQMVKRTLSERDGAAPGKERRLDVRVFLDSLVDSYWIADSAVPGSFAVEMEKRIP